MSEDLPHCAIRQTGLSAPESDYLHGLTEAFDEMMAEAEATAASDQLVTQAAGQLRGDPLMHCQPK